jgi:hypothetical protein
MRQIVRFATAKASSKPQRKNTLRIMHVTFWGGASCMMHTPGKCAQHVQLLPPPPEEEHGAQHSSCNRAACSHTSHKRSRLLFKLLLLLKLKLKFLLLLLLLLKLKLKFLLLQLLLLELEVKLKFLLIE